MSIDIIPKDRTLKKSQYKLLRRLTRKAYKENRKAMEKAFIELLMFGQTYIEFDKDGRIKK
jgi:hypothetical protein